MLRTPSSPRLPSPPPPTEIQIGPKSPSLSDPSGMQEAAVEQSVLDANATRRIHPGTKAVDMAAGPPLIPLGELDSAFQLQEHLKALHYNCTKPGNAEHTVPITRESASLIAAAPEGIERTLWLYELCRFLINKCNDLIVGFLFDEPPCSAITCPEMRASEWQFLCAVHESPKSCCAIDYCCHTLDWATNIVTSQKIFPSRLSLAAGDALDDRGAGVKHLVNIFRRLHRIFAHAWFQHRGVFWQIEGQTGLYVLFKMVCDNYELLPAENYKLPPEAEGLEPLAETEPSVMSIQRSDAALKKSDFSFVEDPSLVNVGRTNTRRHIRSSPSTGSAVTTVLEADEADEADEEDPDISHKLGEMHLEDHPTREPSTDIQDNMVEDPHAEFPLMVSPSTANEPSQSPANNEEVSDFDEKETEDPEARSDVNESMASNIEITGAPPMIRESIPLSTTETQTVDTKEEL